MCGELGHDCCQFPDSQLRAFPAFAASVARRSHTAGLAAFSEIRLIEFVGWDRIPPTIREFKIYGFSLVAQVRTICLLTLNAVALDAILLPVLYEASARTAEHEGHVIGSTLITQSLNPFIVTWTRAAVVFSVA